MHLSVRELVEFTLHGESLTRSASVRDMLDGTVSHKARQKALGEGWEIEAALKMELPYLDEETMTLSGRMDGYMPGDVPQIEEIKLCSWEELPLAPYPPHRAQAVVYGHMVCCLDGAEQVVISTCYVDKKGNVRKSFSEHLTRAQCGAEFEALYGAFVAWHKMLKEHREERDCLISGLKFPYANYRKGQREMAVQVFTAIKQKRRLLSEMPTGTGKSAAVLFPALMALGQGLTSQIFYLTARNTQREAARDCLNLLRNQPLSLWTLMLTAKEKQCFMPEGKCDVENCPYAQGFYVRLPEAINAILPFENWDEGTIREMAVKYQVCPFEFSLSLSEIADVVIGDYNYAFDPTAHIQRIFDERKDFTLLIDESHNLLSRVRDMLSATVDSKDLRQLKKLYKQRSHPIYKALTEAIKSLSALEENGVADIKSAPVEDAFTRLVDKLLDEMAWGLAQQAHFDMYMNLKAFNRSLGGESHAYILEGTKAQKRLTAFCLSVSEHIQTVTAGICGVVFFSATLSPLQDMKILFGCDEEDALFQMPSPFPPENFFIKRVHVNTRYAMREETAAHAAEAIRMAFLAKPGKYIAFFPSFKYMELIGEQLTDLPVVIQEKGMDEAAREAFLNHYYEGDKAVLGLCVMGGIFSEGIDLPGDKLLGVMLTGVGLPQVNIFQETLRDYYQQRFGEGFKYAYQVPGMHKILQAAGRVIRSETDKGVCLLIDDRYEQRAYESLCPPHWHYQQGGLEKAIRLFWEQV